MVRNWVAAAKRLFWGGLLSVLLLLVGAPAFLAVRKRTLRNYEAPPPLKDWFRSLTETGLGSYGVPQLRAAGISFSGIVLARALTVFALMLHAGQS